MSFSAYTTGSGTSVAHFKTPGAAELIVTVSGFDTAELLYEGLRVDGFGFLSSSEEAVLNTLDQGPFSDALRLIPLEVACWAEGLQDVVLAALLFPWQMLHKYRTFPREDSLMHYVASAPCLYLPTAFELSRTSKPLPRHSILPKRFPFPHIGEYLPLDEVGWLEGVPETGAAPVLAAATVEAMSQRHESERGPDGAECRGACGADCHPWNYSRHPGTQINTVCAMTADGKLTGEIEEWQTYEVGMHEGCVMHDNCYDDCVHMVGVCENKWGIPGFCFDSPLAFATSFACYRSCDAICVAWYGKERCASWMLGLPPYEYTMLFEYKISTKPAPDVCPPDPDLYGGGVPSWWDSWENDGYEPCEEMCHKCVGKPPCTSPPCNAECNGPGEQYMKVCC